MVRLFKSLLFVLAFASATLITNYTLAQSTATPTPSPSPLNTPTGTSALTPSASEITATATITASITTGEVGAAAVTTTTVAQTTSIPSEVRAPITATGNVVSNDPLEGTILSNRSETIARFFLEGETYQLVAGRSQGIELPRPTTVLNLFNCAGDLAVDTAGCFWDPYLIQQDGFYEIYDASTGDEQPKLMLREAGAPPTGQVWVQNRTGKTESIVFKEDVYEIQPTSVLEFPVSTGVPAILYVRSCLTIDNQSACEWAPKSLAAGVYYAMIEADTPGSQSGSTLTTIDLRPVVGDPGEEESEATGSGEAPEASGATVTTAGPTIVCTVVVPALNIRSGPGLQYDIIGKVRTTDGSSGTVNVTGRSEDNEWLTVDPAAAENGWINNSPNFITCTGDVMGLPVAEAPPPPTPQPTAVVQAPASTDASVPEATQTGEAPSGGEEAVTPAEGTSEVVTQTAPAIPPGQALLVINNGFQHQMRFTLDQLYRPQQGPSEYDLQPGQSIAIVVFPGDIPFTGSTPWSGLSGNASVHVEADQSLTLWLRFEPEDGIWKFRWN